MISRKTFLTGLAAFGLASISTPNKERARARTIQDNPLPHDPVDIPPDQPRRVLAHWHVFPISTDNKDPNVDFYTQEYLKPQGLNGEYANVGGMLRDRPFRRHHRPSANWAELDMCQDIEMAIAAGVDGFQVNIPTLGEGGRYIRYIQTMFNAISRYNLNFAICPCLDCVTNKSDSPIEPYVFNIAHILQNSGALKSEDGRPILSCFYYEKWPPDRWKALLAGLEQRGVRPFFAPMFLGYANVTEEHLALADMVGFWSGSFPGAIARLEQIQREMRSRGKRFMWTVWPQDYRPKGLWYSEAHNSMTFRLGWTKAIESHADMVNILTWNDYSENSHIRPSEGILYSFSDLNRYHSDWYRSGRQPDIKRDVLYYFHRRDFSGARSAQAGFPTAAMRNGPGPYDDAELLSFLVAPGTSEIVSSAGSESIPAPAGVHSQFAPLAPGILEFRLYRDSKMLISTRSPFKVRETYDWQDLLYRGGSSSRPGQT